MKVQVLSAPPLVNMYLVVKALYKMLMMYMVPMYGDINDSCTKLVISVSITSYSINKRAYRGSKSPENVRSRGGLYPV